MPLSKATDLYEWGEFWCVDIANSSDDHRQQVYNWLEETLGYETQEIDDIYYKWGLVFEEHEDALLFYVAFK